MTFIVTLLVLFLPILFEEQDVNRTFESANQAFLNKQYQNAVNQYKTLLEGGYDTPELSFNTGLSYLRLNDLTRARVFLERAVYRKPLDLQFRLGLQEIRQQIGDIYDFPVFPLLKVVPFIRHHLGSKGIFYLTVLSLWLLAILLRYMKMSTLRRPFLAISIGISAILIAGLILDYTNYSIEKSFAVVNRHSVTLLSQPDLDSQPIEEMTAGTKISIEEELGDWVRVHLGNGASGWLHESPYTYILERQ